MGPYYKIHREFESARIQRAVCWTLNNYNYCSSVSVTLQDLDWPTLQYYHCQRARLSLFYKPLHNLIALEIPPHYTPNNHQSRLHHQLSNYLTSIPIIIIPELIYKDSTFLRTISEWNAPPTGVIISTTLLAFQSQLAIDSYLHHYN